MGFIFEYRHYADVSSPARFSGQCGLEVYVGTPAVVRSYGDLLHGMAMMISWHHDTLSGPD